MARTRKTLGVPWQAPASAIPRREPSELERENWDNYYRSKPRGSVVPRKGFIEKHKYPLGALAAAGGFASAEYIDGFRFYPMADKVPPAALASGVLFLGALAVDHFAKRRDWAALLGALAVGVAIGGLGKASAKKQGGST